MQRFLDQFMQQMNMNPSGKCYNPLDRSLTFVDGDDDHDFELEEFTSKRARMSCGHTVTPPSLTYWCQRQLNNGKSRLECGVCNTKWSLNEVFKMALLTEAEKTSFEKILNKNYAINDLKTKSCPGCKSFVLRKDPNNLCVRCPQCTADRKAAFDFCWQCQMSWRGPAYRSDHCDNRGCVVAGFALVTLQTCSVIEFRDVKGVAGCPSIRACPTCGLLVEHNSLKCKNQVCPGCKVEFCFVCLKLTRECSKVNGSYYEACTIGVAPRQTSIPVKRNV